MFDLVKKVSIFTKKLNLMGMYVIIKKVKKRNGVSIPVILLNSDHEVWEFEDLDKATEMKTIFETNSDSGHEYEVKKI
jgi:hypothetical protein